MKTNFGTPLSRNEMKHVMGGVQQPVGNCAAEDSSGGVTGIDNTSKASAMSYASAHGTHWCCDHCSSASWYNGDM